MKRPLDPEPIFQALNGHVLTAALKAAVELDIFSAVDEGKRTALAIAQARGGTERSMRILLDGIAAATGLLRKSGAKYALSPLARTFLARRSPQFLGDLMKIFAHPMFWGAYARVADAVRAGTSVMETTAHSKDQVFWEDFARATFRDATPKAEIIIKKLGRLPKRCEVLDVACGSGAYGAAFAKRGARVTLLDQPNVLKLTRDLVDAPVRTLEGDLFTADWGGPYDIVLLSHVYHHFDAKECAAITKRAASALRPGGRLVIQEFVPDDARAKRARPLLFALTMLLWTRAGDAYTLADYKKWLAADFAGIHYHPTAMPGDLIVARRR